MGRARRAIYHLLRLVRVAGWQRRIDFCYRSAHSGFLSTLGFYSPLFYIQLDAIEHGVESNLAFYSVRRRVAQDAPADARSTRARWISCRDLAFGLSPHGTNLSGFSTVRDH